MSHVSNLRDPIKLEVIIGCRWLFWMFEIWLPSFVVVLSEINDNVGANVGLLWHTKKKVASITITMPAIVGLHKLSP